MAERQPNGDYLFERVTADRLARAMIGDVRVSPMQLDVERAQNIIDHLGTLYRLRADFHAADWQKR